jgi:23S rRNA (pseudouridine1915-N3)-methyltransferase
MTITILCPSALTKDNATKELIAEYIKRISGEVNLIEVSVKIKSNDTDQQVKDKQGQAIVNAIDKLSNNTAIIAMDERGKTLSSPDLANQIQNFNMNGQGHLCFIIGGAFGLSDDVLKRADLKLSLGKMVWPHRLVALMILEQIYRAMSINAGHPYHKA